MTALPHHTNALSNTNNTFFTNPNPDDADMSEPTTSSGSHRLNVFARRDEYSSRDLLMYKITTSVSWLLFLVSALYYTFNKPHEGHHPHGKIWQHNYATPFAQSSIITSIYW
jgi:hypothetical protein